MENTDKIKEEIILYVTQEKVVGCIVGGIFKPLDKECIDACLEMYDIGDKIDTKLHSIDTQQEVLEGSFVNCPFHAEINNDHSYGCNCGGDRQDECAMDI